MVFGSVRIEEFHTKFAEGTLFHQIDRQSAYDGVAASRPNAQYSATLTRTAPPRIIGVKTMYARSSSSTDQFPRMMKYERIVIVGEKDETTKSQPIEPAGERR
ncbi:MAG: hypothetical protein WAK55_31635, partial [Xanthobacteraceae bacterium]